MSVLSRDAGQQLRNILAGMPAMATSAGRTVLLQSLSPALVQTIPRDEVPAIDLTNIVAACERWEVLPDTPAPLGLLLATALAYAEGPSRLQLESLIATLPPGFVPAQPRPPCPYPGMVPFRVEDARFFYGRDTEIAQMLQRLREQSFLLVIGPSGCGKSSLVFAGLLPRLCQQQSEWAVISLRPGEQPGQAPTVTLATKLGGDLAHLEQAVTAALAAHAPAHRLLMIVDQLEELFTQSGREEQDRFFTALQALRTLDTCIVLATVRADFFPDLLNSNLWQPPPASGERLEIAPLRGDALHRAIAQPAADLGVIVEPALVARLRGDAADEPGSLPLLQETLVRLWEQIMGRTLTLAAYEALGHSYAGATSGLAAAIAYKADATMTRLHPSEQALARRIFLRLIAFGEGRADTRRQQTVSALGAEGDDPAVFQATLQLLTDHRLLTTSGGAAGRERVVDIAHEALIQAWPTLRGWIGERRAAEQMRRRLEDQAAEWARLGQSRGGLLDAIELGEAERWLVGPDTANVGVSSNVWSLVVASHRAHRRTLRLRQGLVGALCVAFLISVVFAILIFQANTESQHQARIAHAQAIAANAIVQAEHDPELALLLGMQAISVTRTVGEPIVPQAEEVLHQVLDGSPLLHTLYGHRWGINNAAWSPDGQNIVTASWDGRAKVWDATSGQLRITLVGHEDYVRSVAWSPDGQRIVTASDDETAKVWDATSGREQVTLRGHTSMVWSAAWSPDGESILTTSDDGTAKVWDATSGQIRSSLASSTESWHRRATWSPDGQSILTINDSGIAIVWDAPSGLARHIFHSDLAEIDDAVWSSDGRSIITTNEDGTAKIWDAISGQERTILGARTVEVKSAEWSPNSKSIVSVNADATVTIWDAMSGHEQATLHGLTAIAGSAAWSPNGQWIFTADRDGTAKVWDVTSGQVFITLNGTLAPIKSGIWSPDGVHIVTLSEDSTATQWTDTTAKVWDVRGGTERATLYGHTDHVRSAAWSPDGQRIVTSSNDGTAKVWDATSGQVRATLRGHTDHVPSAAWSPDGQRIVTSSTDGTAKVWDATSGREQFTLRGQPEHLVSAAWSPDGQRIVTASWDETVKVWDAMSGQEQITLRGHKGPVMSVAWSPDGQHIITASLDGTAKVWDAPSGQLRFTIPAEDEVIGLFGVLWSPNEQRIVTISMRAGGKVWDATNGQGLARLDGYVTNAAWSPDGHYIATTSTDGTAKVWDATGRQKLAALSEHKGRVVQVAWSPDNKSIVTTSEDGTARVWDAMSWRERAILTGHKAAVVSAGWSPDGHYIVTASSDGTARQYVIDLGELMTLAASRVNRTLTSGEQITYLGDLLPTPMPNPPSP